MSDGKVICPECRFEFDADEAAGSPGGTRCPRCGGKISLQHSFADLAVPETKEVPPLLSAGTIFDKYRILSFLGAGGMSEVYKAEHLLLKQLFALKIMKKHDSGKESIFSKRFLREAKCFHLLEHPHIVRIYDIGCDPSSGMLYIAMEYLPEGKLDTAKKFPESEMLKVASDIAKALLELEKHQMVHRDIKPSNILCSGTGSYKLTDLGIAKNRWEDGSEHTLTLDNCLIGTPAYTSPEQCRAPHEVDIRSDIYSLGVTLYQLVSGILPYQGDTPLETALNVLHKEPPSLRKLDVALSEQAIELIECMMEKAPENRPRNAQELCRMIEAVRQGNSPLSFRNIFRRKKLFAAAAALLIAAGAGVWGYTELFPEKKVLSPAAPLPPKKLSHSKAPVPAVQDKRFTQRRFIASAVPRTLPVRVEEFRKMIAFLKSPEAEGVTFREERLQRFTQCEKVLTTRLYRKKERQKRRDRVAISPVLKKEIEKFLKLKLPPFYRDKTGVHLVNKIMNALREEKIDPDTLFTDGNGNKRSLVGLAFNGMLPLSESLLKILIFSGADIDAGHGPERGVPAVVWMKRIKRRMTGIMTVNGADNVDLQQGKPLLAAAFEPLHTYRVCRPSALEIDWNLIALLVESGSRLDVADNQGRTPVHLAAANDREELLRKILLAGADVNKNTADLNGETPYLAAVRNHALKAQQELVLWGLSSPVSEADRAQGSLIDGIIKDEPLQVEQALDSGASLTYVYANGFNALQSAVLYGRSALVKFFLERGASFDANSEKNLISSIAICAASPDILRMILEKRLPENMADKIGAGRYWLPEAVLVHHRKNVTLTARFLDVLQTFQWDINQPGPQGLTFLEHTFRYKDISLPLVRMLLEKGADPAEFLARKKVSLKNLPIAIRQLILDEAKKKSRL